MGGDNNREVVALVGLLLLCTTDKLKLKQKTNKWIRIISKKGKEQQRDNNSKSSQAVELTGSTPFVAGVVRQFTAERRHKISGGGG